jgi:TRAP-type C4-dicarboxylate transport system permease small subunit
VTGPDAAAGSIGRVLVRVEQVATVWSRRLALAGGCILVAVAVTTVADALLRKFLSRPIHGTFEASELLLAVIVYFAMPYTALTDSHVVLDLTTNRLSPRGQHAVIGVNALVCAIVLGVIAWQMGLLAEEYVRTSRTTITSRIPVAPFILPVTVTTWLSAAGFLGQALGGFARALGAVPIAASASR